MSTRCRCCRARSPAPPPAPEPAPPARLPTCLVAAAGAARRHAVRSHRRRTAATAEARRSRRRGPRRCAGEPPARCAAGGLAATAPAAPTAQRARSPCRTSAPEPVGSTCRRRRADRVPPSSAVDGRATGHRAAAGACRPGSDAPRRQRVRRVAPDARIGRLQHRRPSGEVAVRSLERAVPSLRRRRRTERPSVATPRSRRTDSDARRGVAPWHGLAAAALGADAWEQCSPPRRRRPERLV